jgi:hypothetical protein
MTTKPTKDSEWLFNRIFDYYEVSSHTLAVRGAAFEALYEADRKRISQLVSQRVQDISKQFNNEVFVKMAWLMVDDLYRAGLEATVWGPGYQSYVQAVWGTMFAALKSRGYTIRYIVENTWPDDDVRPVQFFPLLFESAGIRYICPSAFAAELPEFKGAPMTNAGLKLGMREGRHIAQMAMKEVAKQGKHFAYFETDFDPGCLDIVFALPSPPGTIEVFRNEAAVPGSNVKLAITPLEGTPLAT